MLHNVKLAVALVTAAGLGAGVMGYGVAAAGSEGGGDAATVDPQQVHVTVDVKMPTALDAEFASELQSLLSSAMTGTTVIRNDVLNSNVVQNENNNTNENTIADSGNSVAVGTGGGASSSAESNPVQQQVGGNGTQVAVVGNETETEDDGPIIIEGDPANPGSADAGAGAAAQQDAPMGPAATEPASAGPAPTEGESVAAGDTSTGGESLAGGTTP